MSDYNFASIEEKWQKYWDENKTFKVTEDPNVPKDKRCYVLGMFPYPSSAGLHVGHPEGYTANDMYSRFLLMNGYNVLHPMGYDSFGLPAENYAIKTGIHPRICTEENIQKFEKQLKSFGYCYDWDRKVCTHDEHYYKWTQWIFLKLFEQGLAYESEMPINFCPSCKTGLANEEVKDGCCERCHAKVERKNLRQWVLKITAYADRLLEDLESLDWSESIKTMQRNWIGRSEGANVRFTLEDGSTDIEVYTTRPDTLFGATYMVLAPEHPLVDKITTPEQKQAIEDYKTAANRKSDMERTELAKDKTGVCTGAYAVNPVNNEKVPVWISDYILMSYGTGAIMAVPGHDERDFEFAKKFDIPIIQVVSKDGTFHDLEQAFTEEGVAVNSGEFDGLPTKEFKEKITEWLNKKGKGKKAVNYKLRDWIFSRQRYWGEPIPLVHCEKCGIVPVPYDQLPLTLPVVKSFVPSGTGESPLAVVDEWVNTSCPKCGGAGKRETNTMPQWAGSCWYYLRYLDPHNEKEFASKEKIDYWMPVNLYVGGAEHAVLHLLYSRFWHKVLFDLGLVNTNEPFQRLVNQGMITSFAYERPDKSLVPVDEVEEKENDTFIETATGKPVNRIIAKMSKTLKNVVNPDDVVHEFGADVMRLYIMFMGPLEVSKPWATSGIYGIKRFLERVFRNGLKPLTNDTPDEKLVKLLHKTIKKVTEDTGSLAFNTAIAQMMVFTNEINSLDTLPKTVWESFILLLSPYAPHLAEELWEKCGNKASVSKQTWPVFDETLVIDDIITLIVQINGKVRSKLEVARGLSKEQLQEEAMNTPRIQELIEGKDIVKIIAVPDRLVNIVIKG